MRIDVLIDRLEENPGGVLRELVAKREEMVAQIKEIGERVDGISKVIRIARDADARQRRSDTEISALRDALVNLTNTGCGDETIDLDHLYLDNLDRPVDKWAATTSYGDEGI